MIRSYRVVLQSLLSGEIRFVVQYNNGDPNQWFVSSHRNTLPEAIELIKKIKSYDVKTEEVVYVE